jgi:cytochrome c
MQKFMWMAAGLLIAMTGAAVALDRVAILEAVHSGKCLDVGQFSKDPGAPIIQFSCTGADNQKWTIKDTGKGAHEITVAHSGMCMDVFGASNDDATPIVQYPCNGQANQRFLISEANGVVRITSVSSSKCLDIEGGVTTDLAKLIQFACGDRPNQQFRLK